MLASLFQLQSAQTFEMSKTKELRTIRIKHSPTAPYKYMFLSQKLRLSNFDYFSAFFVAVFALYLYALCIALFCIWLIQWFPVFTSSAYDLTPNYLAICTFKPCNVPLLPNLVAGTTSKWTYSVVGSSGLAQADKTHSLLSGKQAEKP